MGRTRYQVKTEAEILRRIPGLTRNRLYRMRSEMGQQYLLDNHPRTVAEALWKEHSFWNWWLRMWEINDKHIIHALVKSGLDWGECWFYEKMQISNCKQWDMLKIVGEKEAIVNNSNI